MPEVVIMVGFIQLITNLPLYRQKMQTQGSGRTSFPVMGGVPGFHFSDSHFWTLKPADHSASMNFTPVQRSFRGHSPNPSSTACSATCILASLSPPFLLLFLPAFLLCLFCRCPGLWKPPSGTLPSIPGQKSPSSSISQASLASHCGSVFRTPFYLSQAGPN